MTRRFLFSVLPLLFPLQAFCQLYCFETDWKKLFGPKYSNAVTVAQTPDGGFLTGLSQIDAANAADIWLVKTNASGAVLWEKTFGGDGYDNPRKIRVHPDGSFVVMGHSTSTGISSAWHWQDAVLLKYAANGTLLWWKNYGNPDPLQDDSFWDVRICNDGGYILCGATDEVTAGGLHYFNMWIIRTDASGQVKWNKNYGGDRTDVAHGIVQTSDGGFILIGNSDSSNGDFDMNDGESDVWMLKLDPDGQIVWKKHYGSKETESWNFIEMTPDGGFLVAGNLEENNPLVPHQYGSLDAWVCRLDALGNLVWKKNFGGSKTDALNDLSPGPNGWYWINCFTTSSDIDLCNNAGNTDYWTFAVDLDGQLTWSETFGGSGYDNGWGIYGLNDGFIAVGQTESDNGDIGQPTSTYFGWLIKVKNTVTKYVDLGPADSLLCGPSELRFDLKLPVSIPVYWNNKPGGSVFTSPIPGKVLARATLNGCNSADTITLQAGPVLDLPADTAVCATDSLLISVNVQADSVFWSTGDEGLSLQVHQAGVYSAIMYVMGCASTDSILVNEQLCGNEADCIRFPNAFSPNGDDVNDTFQPVYICDEQPEVLSFRIFNRWGLLVYAYDGKNQAQWNGEYGGSNAPSDVYVWTVVLQFSANGQTLSIHRSGEVTLLR